MNLLKKVAVGVLLLILTKAFTLLLDQYSPATVFYHQQLFFCTQLVILMWMVLICVFHLFKLHGSIIERFSVLWIAMLILSGDAAFYTLIQNPKYIPVAFLQPFSRFYTNYERNIMQYEPYCAYDSNFFYRIRPASKFKFENIEFANTYTVNSRSFRDDESSMAKPNVICIGDSYTFGWGVASEETYSSLLEKYINKNVLNAGHSSYATVRELHQLTLADTSSLQYLVIQYSRTDDSENATYLRNKGVLPISSPQAFELAKKQYWWAQRYFPGKYVVSIGYDIVRTELRKIKHGTRTPLYVFDDRNVAARNFLEVLARANIPSHVKIIVFDLDGYYETRPSFVNAVDSLSRELKYASIRRRLSILNITNIFSRDDFFLLDTHINERGHMKVAKQLTDIITKPGY